MTFSNSRLRLFYRILMGAVISIVLAIAVVQYRASREDIQSKLITAYLDYSYSIYRTVVDVFDPYSLLLKIIYDPELLQNGKKLPLYIESLVNKIKIGKDLDYLTTFGYCPYPVFDNYREYNTQTGRWEASPIRAEQLEQQIQSLAEKDRYSFQFFTQPSDDLLNTLYVIDKETRMIITITFNTSLLYQSQIIPILEATYPHLELKWMQGSDLTQSAADDSWLYYNLKYSFSVFKLIFQTGNNNRWLIPLPKQVLDLAWLAKIKDNRMDDVEIGSVKKYFKSLNSRDGVYAFLEIRKDNEPVLLQLEKELALTWLMQLLLLLSIGAAFVLLLLQLLKMQQQRLREKEFVASITHELKTPLTIIRSAAENIKRGAVPAKRLASYGGHLLEQTNRLTTLVEEILLFSKLESRNHRQVSLTAAYPQQIVQQIADELNSLSTDHTISLDLASLPKAARLDAESFAMIIRNLVINAQTHAYPDGKGGIIRITAWLRIPNKLVFTVEDEGAGIHRSELIKIFQPFYRSKASKNRQIKGSGLGLFLAYKKARLMHGTLKVASPYQRKNGKKVSGCRFTLQIPYLPPDKQGANV